MKKVLPFLLCAWLFPLLSFGQDTLRAMFYNLYRFPDNAPANREFILQDILAETKPDLLMACEIISEDGANQILNTAFNLLPDAYAGAQFHYAPSAEGDPLQQMVYYNTRKLQLVKETRLFTQIRDINHYTFYLKTDDESTDSLFMDVFVTHLKAGDGNANKSLRANMADTFVQALSQIPTNHYVLFAGDLNFYDDQEPAYQILLDSLNPIIMVDPIDAPGTWHDNPNFKSIHTQATRETLSGFGLGGASGGMDDRFDFILMSKNLREDPLLTFVPGSYKAVGNNGNCLDKAINDPSCFGAYSLALRNLLFQMSDHTPVVMDLAFGHQFPPLGIHPINPKTGFDIEFPKGNIVDQQLLFNIKSQSLSVINSLPPIQIFDPLGRLIFEVQIKDINQNISISTKGWASGIYFIRFGGIVKRILKN